MLLHVLAHVDADDGALVVEQELRQRPGELGLADAGGAEEQERPDRPVGVAQPRPRPPDGIRHDGNRLVLADDPVVQRIFHAHELLQFTLHELAHRDPRRAGDHLGDILLVDLLLQHLGGRLKLGERGVGRLQLLGELDELAVAKLAGPGEVALALGPLGAGPCLLDLRLDRRDAVDRLLLERPVRLQSAGLLAEAGELLLQLGEALLRGGVLLLAQSRPLYLQLLDAGGWPPRR